MADFFPDALCRGYSHELWFPPAFDEDPTGTDSEYYEVAKMVCSVCPHKSECQVAGAEERYGMWGGLTPAERRRGTDRPPKRSMSRAAFELLPAAGERVDINPLRERIKLVTHKRTPVG